MIIPENLRKICSGERTDLSPEELESYRRVCESLENGGTSLRSKAVSSPLAKREPRKIVRLADIDPGCSNRGEKIREDVNNICGSKGEKASVFSCSVHGECSLTKYCTRQKPRVCFGCEDRQIPEEKQVMPPPFPVDRRGGNPFAYNPSNAPEFVTTKKLMEDVSLLISKLPPNTSRIIGVSRSGLLPASLIAMTLHLPLLIVRQSRGDMIDGGNGWRLTGNTGGDGPAVVIDDTVMTGNSFKHVMPIVWKEFPNAISAAVYVNPAARIFPNITGRSLPHPHLLEWNLFNSVFSNHFAVDFDGILCNDCHPHDDDDGERYRRFLESTPLKYAARRVKIPLIVTARLEKYRTETMAWLDRHGIRADKIIMGPWQDNRERARANIGEWKGKHFIEFMHRRHHVKPPMFIESEERQAREIARVSGGVVVCPAAGRCFIGDAA
jgi:orotate phosphoribosyltransferase